MKLSAITGDRRAIDVKFGDEDDAPSVHVVYDPMGYTTAFEQEIEEISRSQFQSIALVKGAAILIKEWDLEDADGNPIPLTEEGLVQVPIAILTTIFQAMRGESKPTSEEGKDSAAGSSPEATSESSLSGTH